MQGHHVSLPERRKNDDDDDYDNNNNNNNNNWILRASVEKLIVL